MAIISVWILIPMSCQSLQRPTPVRAHHIVKAGERLGRGHVFGPTRKHARAVIAAADEQIAAWKRLDRVDRARVRNRLVAL